MQSKMRFSKNERGEIETLFRFSDAFSVTGGGLLSHPSETGDNEITALWTEGGRINKSKLISPAPKSNSQSFLSCQSAESMRHLLGPSEETELLIYGAVWQGRMSGAKKKGVSSCSWCQNRADDTDSTFSSAKQTRLLLRCAWSHNLHVK